MANIRPPAYGVKKDELTLTTQDPAAVIYGVTPDSKWIPVQVDDFGRLMIGSTITLDASDMQIGAVEIKNYNTDDRVFVSTSHEMLTQARLYDAAGVGITSTLIGADQALDINVVGGTTLSPSTDEDDSVPAGMQLATVINLLYGYDGVDWQRINSTSGRLHVDGSGVTQPISAVSLPLPTGAATEVTLAAIETGTDNLDVLLSTRATEITLLGIKSQTDQFVFAATRLVVDASQVAIPVTDNGGSLTIDGSISVSNFPATQTVAIDQTGTNNDVDVIDRVAREVGRVSASDILYVNESYVTTDTLSQARPTNGDLNVRNYKSKQIVVTNTGINSATVTVDASIDNGTNFDIVLANNVAIAAGNTGTLEENRAFTHIRIRARSTAVGNSTTVESRAYAIGA